ncbi:TMV resistance protein N-like protein [Corchorus olitorius]|uniref:TMV resistance protein N-like protein n=1 Tax=Corchorus olitorius TaxID=93759 RepID=A0A1R3JFG1_9ROSI|nr:TMV resistance protein N-like protein [Corchorus olitorius]
MALKRKRFSEADCSYSSSNSKYDYEVFLSFRGEDTRRFIP